MTISIKDLDAIFKKRLATLSESERHVFNKILSYEPVSRNIQDELDDKRTLGERVADRVASFGGSWTFIICFGVVLALWVILNSYLVIKRGHTFDPYPYILLNLFLSMIASIQAPIIMMSQNRHAAKDRLDAAHDYEVNLKAELEIVGLHEKLDELRETKWMTLIALQQRQIELLETLLKNH